MDLHAALTQGFIDMAIKQYDMTQEEIDQMPEDEKLELGHLVDAVSGVTHEYVKNVTVTNAMIEAAFTSFAEAGAGQETVIASDDMRNAIQAALRAHEEN